MEQKNNLPTVQDNGSVEVSINFFASEQNFNLGQRMAKVFATSDLVPKQYQGNVGNVMIAMNMSQRMKADPLMVMQNLVIVHGTPTFEAKFAIACFNATGKYTPIRYEEVGTKGKDSYGMYAYAVDKATGDVLKGPEVTIGLAKKEGWYGRNPKWESIPQLMLRYRAASWFIRTTDPGMMMGFRTTDEVEDVPYATVVDSKTESVVPHNDANVEIIDMDAQEEQKSEQRTGENAKQNNKENETDKQDNEEDKPIGKLPTPDLFK